MNFQVTDGSFLDELENGGGVNFLRNGKEERERETGREEKRKKKVIRVDTPPVLHRPLHDDEVAYPTTLLPVYSDTGEGDRAVFQDLKRT